MKETEDDRQQESVEAGTHSSSAYEGPVVLNKNASSQNKKEVTNAKKSAYENVLQTMVKRTMVRSLMGEETDAIKTRLRVRGRAIQQAQELMQQIRQERTTPDEEAYQRTCI